LNDKTLMTTLTPLRSFSLTGTRENGAVMVKDCFAMNQTQGDSVLMKLFFLLLLLFFF